MCVYAGVATGVGASWRGSGLGRVGRVWAWASVWACISKFFLVFVFGFLVFCF